MVDLTSQYEAIKVEVDAAMQHVIDSTAFIKGPDVKAFESELAQWTGANYVVTCGNGTDALQIAFMALGLEAGDEVIVPAFTYVATAEVLALLGLKPVLVDVLPGTFNIDPKKAELAITSRTKAIVPVHLFGQCAPMDDINLLATKHSLFVVEDAAQSIGAEFTLSNGVVKQAGTIGDFGITSFFPSKNLGCFGDGGALFTNDEALAKKARMIASHGQSVQYHHDIVGINSRLDTLQAAVLRVKLKFLDKYLQSRQAAAEYYDKSFNTIEAIGIPVRAPHSTHVFHQYTLRVLDGRRDELKTYLKEHGIPSMVYYPKPLHFQQAYKNAAYGEGAFPLSELYCHQVISLPMHSELGKEQLEHIAETVLSFFRRR